MAKKPQVQSEPKITALPMGNTDSPLIIDLPDGQKLVVGNLAAGSVIEVATWRGTGRPDSRTSRLMLGMSTGQEKAADADPKESKKNTSSVLKVIRGIAEKFGALASSRKKNSEKQTFAPLIEKVSPVARASDTSDVDDWLNSILEKSAKKSKVDFTTSEPTPKAVKREPAKRVAVKKTTKKSTSRRAR